VFRMTPVGTATVVHSFGSTVSHPYGLIQATDGNFYGYGVGGVDDGLIFRMTPSGTVSILHVFTGAPTDGAGPDGSLIQGADGVFYGTTSEGGASGYGTVFQMTPAGTVTLLHSFASPLLGPDGPYPSAGLIQATDGNLYGTTYWSGAPADPFPGWGTVFRLTLDRRCRRRSPCLDTCADRGWRFPMTTIPGSTLRPHCS
jgi:uncharacterized repeat protein (TIGR03803 family)